MSRTRKLASGAKAFQDAPSQEEIRIRAARIRKEWTPRQHCKRSLSGGPLEIIEIRTPSRRRGFSDEW